jgi:hypothetical protein
MMDLCHLLGLTFFGKKRVYSKIDTTIKKNKITCKNIVIIIVFRNNLMQFFLNKYKLFIDKKL